MPIQRNDTAQPIADLRSETNRLFDDFWSGLGAFPAPFSPAEARAFEPSVDVKETDTAVLVTAELPGLEEKDFELSLDRDTLTLRGEKREEREEKRHGWWHHERRYGSFVRRVPLPSEVEADKAEARFKNGVLEVALPKTEEARRRTVEIPVKAS